jgi:cellobiose phosphorylase
VEAWPEGGQRHLAAESALYCRVYTEGLFGIRPSGLRAFTLTPRLPALWPEMQLKNVRAFGHSFDIRVRREGEKQRVDVVSGSRAVFSRLLSGGETASVQFAE